MIVEKNTIKNFFLTNLKPAQDHFHAWLDSYWHKHDKIPINCIEGINTIYQAINAINAKNPKIVAYGDLQIFKRNNNTAQGLEINDFVKTIIPDSTGGVYIEGVYLGGDIHNIASYDVINRIDFVPPILPPPTPPQGPY